MEDQERDAEEGTLVGPVITSAAYVSEPVMNGLCDTIDKALH